MRILAEDTPLLNKHFQIMTERDQLPLLQITTACEADDGAVRTALHKRLNHLEMIAIGVEQKVLDEELVKEAYKVMFRHTVTLFKNYFEHRRNHGNKASWVVLEKLSRRWTEEDDGRGHEREVLGKDNR